MCANCHRAAKGRIDTGGMPEPGVTQPQDSANIDRLAFCGLGVHEVGEFLDEACRRQADDSVKGAVVVVNERRPLTLDGVGAGLVEGLALAQVVGDFLVGQVAEGHMAYVGEGAEA